MLPARTACTRADSACRGVEAGQVVCDPVVFDPVVCGPVWAIVPETTLGAMTDGTATKTLMTGTIAKRDTAVTPRGVNHIVLNVRNMEESHHFWSDLLGFEQVGELGPRDADLPQMNMRFYSGVAEQVSHHDIALVERPGIAEPAEPWSMATGDCAINHIAVTYPDRESWLEQVQFLRDNGVPMNLRVDHGMTHSVYVNDPNGYGVEVLYDLPEDVWRHDINGALNYSKRLPSEDLLVDDTDYETNFDKLDKH